MDNENENYDYVEDVEFIEER